MKRSLLMAAAVAAFAVPAMAPLAVVAQDGERGGGRRGAARQNAEAEVEARADRVAPRPERPAPSGGGETRPDRPQRPDRPDRPRRPDQPRPERPDGPRTDRPQTPERPRTDRPDRPDRPRTDRPQTPDRPRTDRPNRPGAERPDRPDRPRGDRDDRRDDRRDRREDRRDDRRDRREDRSERRQDRREYREFRQRFNSDQWRRNWNRSHRGDWWRSDRRFRGYNGLRIGFYFAPGYGYYQVPRTYWGQRYSIGDYLPSIFWRYRLDDWRTYGLGYPPEGTRWVLVDNHIYLIDEYDGYIIDVIFDAWSW